jgi:hypothetical protein
MKDGREVKTEYKILERCMNTGTKPQEQFASGSKHHNYNEWR